MCLNGAKSIRYPAVPYSELRALWSLIIKIESGIIESFVHMNITTNFKINLVKLLLCSGTFVYIITSIVNSSGLA